jgi:acyl-CoA synthetase (AMP-forming)/AMP-acid ligase II
MSVTEARPGKHMRPLRRDEEQAKKAYAGGWWVRETLADALRREAQRDPDRVLLIEGEVHVDAGSLLRQSEALAAWMLKTTPSGSVISFMLPNWHEAAVIYGAATLAGMIVHPLLPSLRDRDAQFMLGDVGSRIVFIPAQFRNFDYQAMLARVCANLEDPPTVVVLRGEATTAKAYESLFAEDPVTTWPTVDPDSARMVMYTSGTTGRPKGVIHSHNSLHALIKQVGQHWLIDPGDRFIIPSPISHIGGSMYAFECPLLLGTAAVLMETWIPDASIPLIDQERCTHLAGATPFLEGLLDAAQRAGSRLPSLKVFICGGASVPPSLVQRAADYFENAAVTRVYGSTEVPVTVVGVLDRKDVYHAANTDGRPGIAEIKLVGADTSPIGEGHILARGPQMLRGFIHIEDDEPAFDEEGYYKTGDLGRWVDGDYLVISGRAKDIIIRNGENISPKEVEDLLVEHPDIAEVAIVGVPDARTGERACAVIVPTSGAQAPDVPAIRGFLTERGMAIFKVPERVESWTALPKNDTGKVLKHVIRTTLTAPPAGS